MPNKIAYFSRTSPGQSHVNTLDLTLEDRHVFLAQGLQFHNDQMPLEWRVPESLIDPKSSFPVMQKRKALQVLVKDENNFEYKNYEQGVNYIVKRLVSRSEFQTALTTEGAHVVYAGHARYGRGPCFGRGGAHDPGEQWEDGSGPDNGLFRMGFPFLSVPREEIEHHGYTANPVESSISLSSADCEPDLRKQLSKLKRRTAGEIGAAVTGRFKDPDPQKTWWTHDGYENGKKTIFVVLHADWESTTTEPFDLGATDIRAKVFNHFGCSTLQHNEEVVRKLKGWKQEGDNRHGYFTTGLSFGLEVVFYFYHLFSYTNQGRGREWKPSIEYAVSKSNQDLAASGADYRLK